MAGGKERLQATIYFILHCICFFAEANTAKLNIPRVLLPYNLETPTNFTLQVYDGGCYKWSSSRPDVVLLNIVEENGCSSQAIVSAIARSPTRQTAIILASEEETGGILRCDVIVDTIDRLEIVTTTRELFVEEAPEEFEVRGYDDQGNEFSALDSVVFVWDLQTVTDHEDVVAAQTVLRFMTFEDSPYKTPQAIAPLEEQGLQGYMVLIEGRQTGTARLSVHLDNKAYKNVPATHVNLMVIANLLLDPPDVHLLPYTSITYMVYHLNQGHLSTVDIAASQYYLQVINTEIAELNEDGISVTALSLGTTQVILKDKNVKSLEMVKNPTANVHVVDPSYITLSISPHDNWVVLCDNQYAITVNIYDKDNNKIFLTENVVVETEISADYFKSDFVSKNGTFIHGTAVKVGTTKVTATLNAVEAGGQVLEISPPLKASHKMEIYDKLEVIPPLTILPWDPILQPLYIVDLKARGGSGSETWSSNNVAIATVSQTGHVKTQAKGSVMITAAMTLNQYNKGSGEVHIIEALGIEILKGVVEVEVNKALYLPVALHTNLIDDTKHPFTSCHTLPFKVEPKENTFTTLEEFEKASVKGSCVSVGISSKSPGFSKIDVSYTTTDSELVASTVVGAYRPLRSVSPANGETVLAQGSSRVVVFEGGPLPWIEKPSSHFVKVTSQDPDKVKVERLPVPHTIEELDIHFVLVECQELGEFVVELTVGNTPSISLPNPQEVSSQVKVVCALPDSLNLVALVKRPTGTKVVCPSSAETVAHCHKPLSLEVKVRDTQGRKFDNISSLELNWNVHDGDLANIVDKPSVLTKDKMLHGYAIPYISHQVLNTKGKVGSVLVEAQLSLQGAPTEEGSEPPRTITASLRVKLVEDGVISPSSAIIYNHPDNFVDLKVAGGSGHFELQAHNEKVADVTFQEEEKSIKVVPIDDGDLIVRLLDVCLEADSPAEATIKVASVASLDLIMVDRVQLGDSIEAEVVARDDQGTEVPANNLMKLLLLPQANIISTQYKGMNSKGNAIYIIYGHHKGKTSLRASAGEGEATLFSPFKSIQVFPPLQLEPRNITLVVGAQFQVETIGGPKPDSSVEYWMLNETVAETSSTGLITALVLGRTILTAQAVGIGKSAAMGTVFSKDTVMINVIPITKIRIRAPLLHMETGTVMPLYAMGSDDHQNLFSFGTATPSLQFEWSLNGKQIASLRGVFSQNGITETSENYGVVRVRAERPGRFVVKLTAKPSVQSSGPHIQVLGNEQLVDKIEIQVFETLKLTQPAQNHAHLLLSPGASTRIVTNRIGGSENITYIVESCKNSAVVTVSDDGTVKAGSVVGQATVLVTLQEHFGLTQTISVLIEVKIVSYMQSHVMPFMNVAEWEVLSSVPVGANFLLNVTYHDDRARTFDAVSAELSFRPSRFDLIGIATVLDDNNALALNVRGAGQTVLRIWEDKLGVEDFLRIASKSAVHPDRPIVPMGGSVCFSSNVRSVSGQAGEWTASGSDQAIVIGEKGKAHAQRIGKSVISYVVSPGLTLFTEVIAVPIHKISILEPPVAITNGETEGDHVVPVAMTGEGDADTLCSETGSLDVVIPFTCVLEFIPPVPEVDINDIFTSEAIFTTGNGYACKIASLGKLNPALATSETSLFLEAVVINQGQQEEVRSDKVEIGFVPAAVPEVFAVTLTNAQLTSDLVVSGTSQVLETLQVSASDSRVLETSLGFINGTRRTLILTAKESVWTAESFPESAVVTITSGLTKSQVAVTVNFETVGDGTCQAPQSIAVNLKNLIYALWNEYQTILIYLFLALATIVFMIICNPLPRTVIGLVKTI
ncbi:nucleoporin 210 isoform X2 [Oratosquilla oratoria]|uniref:nucleoporin 210 isoform X2 n=1 Tax=Oratosquilla oratoria TaxID=337810 RepID=UPI003F76B722